MKLLVNNLQRQYSLHAKEYNDKAIKVLSSGWYVLGKELNAFEEEFASYIGTRYCVGLASGLDALEIAFRTIGIHDGDEVLVSSNAYIACVMGITKNGGIPIFVEPDQYDNINADKLEEKITDKTKAILAVHLYGQSCDMTKIEAVAKKHNLKIVEDCAQAHGTVWNGQKCGSFGDVACWSFYPTKNLGAFGDGGAITTNHECYDADARMIRNYGSRVRYEFEVIGMNSRLDELQAGMLRIKLKYLDELNEERRRIAERYNNGIHNPLIRLLDTRPGSNNVWHQYVIHVLEYRNKLIEYLDEKEIGTLIHYPIPPHLSLSYKGLGYKKGDFPIAEKNADEVLSIPMFNGITDDEVNKVIDSLNSFRGE